MVTDTLFFFKVRSYHDRPSLNLLFLAFRFSLWTLLVEKINRNLNAEKAKKFSVWCSISGYQRKVDITSGREEIRQLGQKFDSHICRFDARSRFIHSCTSDLSTKTWSYHLRNGLATPNIGSSLSFSLGRWVSKEGARQLLEYCLKYF